MALSIKTKQVAGLTALVGVVVILLSAWYLASLARVYIEETKARADLVARTIVQRAFDVVASGGDPRARLGTDPGLQSILQGSVAYDRMLQYAAIVDVGGGIIAHNDPALVGQTLPP